jgi:putative transposase
VFNKAYQRSGTLFEGTFRATVVDTDVYLRDLCRYIHGNPVKHGLVSAPELWPYSNYLEWIDKRVGTLVDRQFIREHFETPERYETFVREYLSGRAALPKDVRRMEEGLEA